MSRFTLHRGDSRELLKTLADNSADSFVCDPPYHLTTGKKGGTGPASVNLESPYGRARVGTGFMGMAWDGGDIAHDPTFWAECLRVAKPGAYLVAFGGSRTFHRLACAIEDAGWELRDTDVRGHTPEDCPWLMGWMYGSGFPKSHNGEWGGTAQKPAWEPIVCARKPLIGTVAANFAQWGTGGLNIDACRIGPAEPLRSGAGGTWDAMHKHEGREGEASADRRYTEQVGTDFAMKPGPRGGDPAGRWPANLIHDGSPAVMALFPNSDGQSGAVTGNEPTGNGFSGVVYGHGGVAKRPPSMPRFDSGSAARFFYCAKASKEDRNEGCDGLPRRESGMVSNTSGQHMTRRDGGAPGPTENFHPTVKPTELMRWLVRLVTPSGGIVVDPFTGSGSTGKAAMLEGMRFIGIDRDADADGNPLGYIDIARARIEFALRQGHQPTMLEEPA